VGVFLLSGLPGEAQEATPDPQSPELKVLDRFVGSWELDFVVNMGTGNTKMKADVTTNWILLGRVIQHKFVWSPGDKHGLGFFTYDAEEKAYREWYFDSTGSVPRDVHRGQWDEAAKTLTWKGSSSNGITRTMVNRFIDNDTYEWSLVDKDRSGKVVFENEATAKRKTSVTSSDSHGQGTNPPPPEMKPLQQMVGTWREAHVSKVAEWTPEESRMTSILKVSPILGGHFVRCEVTDDDGKALAMMIRTFDTEQQAYREWMFPPGRFGGESRGQWDEATNTLTLANKRQGITGVTTIRFSDKDTMQWGVNLRDRQGKVYYDALGKSVRQR